MTRSEEPALCGACQAPYSAHDDGACPEPAALSDGASAAAAGPLTGVADAGPVSSAPAGPGRSGGWQTLAPAGAGSARQASAGDDRPPADQPANGRPASAVSAPAGPELGNGQAVTGLIFGILSIVGCWLGLIAVALVILALAFSVIGILRARLHFSDGMGLAVTGVVLAIAGLGLYLAFGALSLGMGFRV